MIPILWTTEVWQVAPLSLYYDDVSLSATVTKQSLRKQHKEVGSFRFPNKSKFNTFAEHTKVDMPSGVETPRFKSVLMYLLNVG